MRNIVSQTLRTGFSFAESLNSEMPMIELAHRLGKVIDVSVLCSSKIPTIQSLRPTETESVGKNRYSGHFGLGTFPLHTDLAHWSVPPRYVLLRCVVGTEDVVTTVLPQTNLVTHIGMSELRRAVFAVRKRGLGRSNLVRAVSKYDECQIFRWDAVFLKPMNAAANRLDCLMKDPVWDRVAEKVLLRHPGDTLLIDNWRMLHGRGAVPDQGRTRLVERAYLSEVVR
jgi:L-asparagine oxygenase